MGEIINLLAYKMAKEQERKRIKESISVSYKIDVIDGILNNINNSIGVSISSKYFNGRDISSKDVIVDDDLLEVICNAIVNYKKDLKCKLEELDNIK